MGPVGSGEAPSAHLTPWERLFAALVAVLAGLGAWRLIESPPTMTQASSSCVKPECVLRVSSSEQTVVVALIALAAVAALIAILGVRFTKVSAAGASLEGPSVAEVDQKDAAEKTKGALGASEPAPQDLASPSARAQEPSDQAWRELPGWAQRALISWAQEGSVVTQPLRFAVLEAAKEPGKGNHPWYVKVRLDNGEIRTLRVATGRGGTTAEEPGG
jgi:hypothetical protein